jgi:hypothetical protein
LNFIVARSAARSARNFLVARCRRRGVGEKFPGGEVSASRCRRRGVGGVGEKFLGGEVSVASARISWRRGRWRGVDGVGGVVGEVSAVRSASRVRRRGVDGEDGVERSAARRRREISWWRGVGVEVSARL